MRWRQPEGEKSEILPCLVHKVQCQQSKWISHSPVGDGMWCGLTRLCADPIHTNSPFGFSASHRAITQSSPCYRAHKCQKYQSHYSNTSIYARFRKVIFCWVMMGCLPGHLNGELLCFPLSLPLSPCCDEACCCVLHER